MSAAPRIPFDMPCEGLRMTAEEFLALGETDQRLELVDGVVVVSPSPLQPHQRVARQVLFQLMKAAEAMRGLEVFYEIDVVLAERLVYRPDIVVFAPGRLTDKVGNIEVVPDLVVEVLSPDNRRKDLVTKRADYEKHGVGEYWIVEPSDVSVVQLFREGGRFVERPLAGDVLVCASIPGIRVDLAPVRRALQ